MDERDAEMEWTEGEETVTTPEEPDATVEDEPGVAAGEEQVEEGAAGGEETATGADELKLCGDVGTEEPTLVGCDVETEKPAWIGSGAGSDEPHDGVAAVGTGIKEAVIEEGGSEAEWKRRAEGYASRVVFFEARAAAAAMGVPENRLDQVAKLSDLSGIDPEDEGARERIEQVVRVVLRELPELRGGVGTGQATTPRKVHRDAFERGFLGE